MESGGSEFEKVTSSRLFTHGTDSDSLKQIDETGIFTSSPGKPTMDTNSVSSIEHAVKSTKRKSANGKNSHPVLTIWDVPAEDRKPARYAYAISEPDTNAEVEKAPVNLKVEKMVAVIHLRDVESIGKYKGAFSRAVMSEMSGISGEEAVREVLTEMEQRNQIEIRRQGLELTELSSLLLKSEIEGLITDNVRGGLEYLNKYTTESDPVLKRNILDTVKENIANLESFRLNNRPGLSRYQRLGIDKLKAGIPLV